MPGFNGTGPLGMGPMTGGGRGRCNPYWGGTDYYRPYYGYGYPGYIGYGYSGYGGGYWCFGRGGGFGRGRGLGRGRGRRWW